jgi:uncharacterized protein
MEFFYTISQNILSPAMLFFALGVVGGFIKSDLAVPDSISRYFSLYLMMAIGLKGGVAISQNSHLDYQMMMVVVAAIAVGFLQPFIAYYLLRLTTKLDIPTAAAVAAHYGSISMVTFVTASEFLKANNIIYDAYIVAVLSLMEAPAILSGLYIAHRALPQTKHKNEEQKLKREIFTNGSILLLLGAFFIGLITGKGGMDKVGGFFETPFQGILCFYLLDMGLLVAKNLHHLQNFTIKLVLFGMYMPLVGACIGLSISYMLGLNLGTGSLFTVLCASSSYIAVPAAMRLALPEAKVSIYLPMSLAITFPFNISLGVPLYFALAKVVL